MVLAFYYDLRSQPCRSVWLFLKATEIPFEDHPISLTKGEHLQPELLKKNPFHKLPFIDDDGFPLAESVAIIQYLAVKYNVAEHWYPRSDVQREAKINEFLHWHHHNIRRHEVDIFIPTFCSRVALGTIFGKQPLDKEKVDNAKTELARSIKHLEEYFLAGRPFILGEEISAADITGACELMQLTIVGEEGCYECNENVKAWMSRVKERLHPHFDAATVGINDMKQNFNSAAE